MRPGREHDTTCARTHDGLLDTLDDWADSEHAVLADLGYEGENARLRVPIKKTRGAVLTAESAPSTPCIPPPGRWPNEGTRCSRPPSKPCAGSVSAPGGSARSPLRRWSCSITSTDERPDQLARPITYWERLTGTGPAHRRRGPRPGLGVPARTACRRAARRRRTPGALRCPRQRHRARTDGALGRCPISRPIRLTRSHL